MASPRLQLAPSPAPAAVPHAGQHAPPTASHAPDARLVASWRQQADARMELALTDFDSALIDGLNVEDSALAAMSAYMSWTRQSLRPLMSAGARPVGRLHTELREQERIQWSAMAESAAARARTRPDGVDRFLRIWLAVVHEAASTGFALYYCDPGPPPSAR